MEQEAGGMPLTSQHSDAVGPMLRVAVVVAAARLPGDYAREQHICPDEWLNPSLDVQSSLIRFWKARVHCLPKDASAN